MQEEIKADEVVQAAAATEVTEAMMDRFRFSREQIDSIRATPSFIGLILSSEPQASRRKMVLSLESLQQLVKAGHLLVERSVPDDGRME